MTKSTTRQAADQEFTGTVAATAFFGDGSGLTNLPAASPDGSTAAKMAASAQFIKEHTHTNTDGLYWINNGLGAAVQVYCDMNTSGGGWMLATKNTNVNAFGYYQWGSTSDVEYTTNSSDMYSIIRRYLGVSEILIKWQGDTIHYSGAKYDSLAGIRNGEYSRVTGGDLWGTSYSQCGTLDVNNLYIRHGGPGHRGTVFSNHMSNSNNQGGIMEWQGPYITTTAFYMSSSETVGTVEIYIR